VSWAIVGGLAGGLLGGAGSVGGSLLSKPESPNARRDQLLTFPQFTDPAQNAATFDALMQLGIVSPSLLTQSGPLSQLVNSLNATPGSTRGHEQHLQAIASIIEGIQNGTIANANDVMNLFSDQSNDIQGLGKSTPKFDELRRFTAQLGLSLDDLITQEKQFQTIVKPRISEAQQTAEQVFTGRQNINRQLAQMANQTQDFGAMRDLAKSSLTTDINRVADLGRADLLKSANAGNYNPGRAVSELELQRSNSLRDIDLMAIDRASALISGQAQQASYLQGLLQPGLAAAQTAAAQRTGAMAGGVQAIGTAQANTPRVSGVGAALSGLGAAGSAGLNNYYAIQALSSLGNKPAYSASDAQRMSEDAYRYERGY
jgi:hypothetical protein